MVGPSINLMTTTQTMVTFFESFSDGSGAPATVESMGLKWTFDTLGTIRCNRLDSRQFVKRGIVVTSQKLAQRAYESKVAELGAEWSSMNRAMYLEVR